MDSLHCTYLSMNNTVSHKYNATRCHLTGCNHKKALAFKKPFKFIFSVS